MNIATDSDYRWLTPISKKFLVPDYVPEGETLDSRVNVICSTAERILGIPGFGMKLKGYIQKGWISLSTPIWTNFGNDRGLPISCFGSHVEDTMQSILGHHFEVGVMSQGGGGTSGYWSDVRPRNSLIKGGLNGRSHGPMNFLRMFDTAIQVVSQGSSRRGQYAAYLSVDHPDIMEFLQIKTEHHAMQMLNFGVCISDAWMHDMVGGDKEKRLVWAEILKRRSHKGFPYIFWTDNANNGAPDVYRDKGMKITHSNLCTEIMEPDSDDESFVCDLASTNALYFDEWKDTDMVETSIFLLDAVMTEFIEKASKIPGYEKAVRFAQRHRALGLGQMGWHSYLQSKMVPYESFTAKLLNTLVASTIQKQAMAASVKLAQLYGEPELLKGYGRRNTVMIAHAPTKSTAFINGQVSENDEPINDNYYTRDLQKITYAIRNPQLMKVLEEKGKNDEETWMSILRNEGSVQNLKCLSDEEKAVFKTLKEISPMEVILQAAQRQKYIDQGQSLNILIDPKTPKKDVNQLYIKAWQLGIKSMYYQYNENAAQQQAQSILHCQSCDG